MARHGKDFFRDKENTAQPAIFSTNYHYWLRDVILAENGRVKPSIPRVFEIVEGFEASRAYIQGGSFFGPGRERVAPFPDGFYEPDLFDIALVEEMDMPAPDSFLVQATQLRSLHPSLQQPQFTVADIARCVAFLELVRDRSLLAIPAGLTPLLRSIFVLIIDIRNVI